MSGTEDWSLNAGAFEQRLRDVGALGGDCLACGGQGGREHLEHMLFHFQHGLEILPAYVALCPTCGHIEWFTPIVLKAWEGDPEGG